MIRNIWFDTNRVTSEQLARVEAGDGTVLTELPPDAWGDIYQGRGKVADELLARLDTYVTEGDWLVDVSDVRDLIEAYRTNKPW